MDRLALDDPAMTAEIGREVGHHFMEGHYHRLPIEVFPMDKMREALEFMKTGKHVGKVVLTNYDKDSKPVAVTVEKPQHVRTSFFVRVSLLFLARYAWQHRLTHMALSTPQPIDPRCSTPTPPTW